MNTTRFDLHLCDGGYSDNTGVVAATEACNELIDAIAADCNKSKFRVLFARIEPFPEKKNQPPDSEDGFTQAILGPANGLLSARIATQQERADRETEQFIRNAKAKDIAARQIIFRFGKANCPPHEDESPPLSWSLSIRQQNAIENKWKEITKDFSDKNNLFGVATDLLPIEQKT